MSLFIQTFSQDPNQPNFSLVCEKRVSSKWQQCGRLFFYRRVPKAALSLRHVMFAKMPCCSVCPHSFVGLLCWYALHPPVYHGKTQ